MPRCILIIGILFCICGVLNACDLVFELFYSNRFNFNLGVLMLPVGIGLLRGQDSSRRWASVWLGLGIVSGSIVGCVTLGALTISQFSTGRMNVPSPGSYPFGGVAHWVLSSSRYASR
ncbi:MAG: hypothetical protein EOP85_02380 [Verrucomicrobiaceae bacterium]|nr:MAG: hypothetical protein EOP85_02380 [Verrucomicrobiaceae bacterium]